MTLRLIPFLRSPAVLLGLLSLVVVLAAGCDAGGDLNDTSTATVSPEETAESIAFSTAETTGGTAADLSDAAALAQSTASTVQARAVSGSRSCTFEDAPQTWTCSVGVSGRGGRLDTIDVDRTYRAQFFSDGAIVRAPAEADSMTFEILSGSGTIETARIDNSHTLLGSSWALGGLQTDTYTIDLLSEQAGRDVTESVSGARRSRVRDASIRRTRVDGVQWRVGGGLAAGRIEGTYAASVEIERASGDTVTRTVDLSYDLVIADGEAELTFTGGGERFTGEVYTFDLSTGEME
jgi:hypothetical protein